MTEYHITRSRDIELYIGGDQLFGVTDFTAKAENEAHPIREYLSGTPHALVSSRTGYELRLTVLSLFCFAVTEQDGFTLSVADGATQTSGASRICAGTSSISPSAGTPRRAHQSRMTCSAAR